MKGILRFDISDGKSKATFVLDLKNGSGSIKMFLDTDADRAALKQINSNVTFIVKDMDFLAIGDGSLNPQMAFLQGMCCLLRLLRCCFLSFTDFTITHTHTHTGKMKLRGDMGKAIQFESVVLAGKKAEIQKRIKEMKLKSKL